MKFWTLVLVLSLCYGRLVAAEMVTVRDAETGEPVENVFIYVPNRTMHVKTDAKGQANLALLAGAPRLVFQHTAYWRLELSNTELTAANQVVTLRPRTYLSHEVEISGLRWHTDQQALAQGATSISNTEIEFSNPPTSADVIAHTGQVFVQKSQLGGGSPMIRGFAANSVLLVMDGVRLNNAIYRSGNLQNVLTIDANTLENVEVLYGPSSVMYGSDAMGGVMLFNSPDPQPSFTNSAAVRGDAMTRFASANYEKTAHGQVEIGYGHWGFLTGLTYNDFDDLRAGAVRPVEYPDYGKRTEYAARTEAGDVAVANENENVLNPSGYSQFNLLQKVNFIPSRHFRAGYGLYYSTSSNIPRYDRLIEYRSGHLRSAQWYYGPQDWLMNRLSLQFADGKWFDEASIILAHQYSQESRHDRGWGSDELAHRTEDIMVYSLNADLDLRLSKNRRLFYGVEATHNDVESAAESENIVTGETGPESTRYPDGGSRLSSFAAYLGHEWQASKAVTQTAGLRYSHSLLNSQFENKSFYDFPYDEVDVSNSALTASLGLTWHPDSFTRLYTSLSSGFRAPNVDDVGKVFDSEPGSVVVPNPDLGAEYSYNIEAGLLKTVWNHLTARGAVYYSHLTNVMVRRDFTFNGQDSILYGGTLSQVQAIVNAGEGYVTGFEFGLDAEPADHWRARTTLTYTAGRDLDNDVPLRHVPPLFGETRLGYHRRSWSGEGSAQYNFDKKFSDLAPEEQDKTHLYTPEGTPGWYTLNVRGAWRPTSQLEVQLALENILDHHYRPFSSGISAPGRNLIVTLRTRL